MMSMAHPSVSRSRLHGRRNDRRVSCALGPITCAGGFVLSATRRAPAVVWTPSPARRQRDLVAQIPADDLHIAALAQLPAAQFAFDDKPEADPLKVRKAEVLGGWSGFLVSSASTSAL